jgi:hypothetical protein
MKTNILLIIAMFFSFSVLAQDKPVVLAIDGVNTAFQSGLSLPYWLKAGQTLNLVQMHARYLSWSLQKILRL